MTPVRQIPIGTRSLTGRHARSGARYESGLERDFYELMAQDPLFDRVDWQPLYVYYVGAGGREIPYTPDALVFFKPDPMTGIAPRPLLVEVKYREEYRERFQELKARLRAARRHAKLMGWRFAVFTEREIRTVRFANRHMLNGFIDRHPSQEYVDQLSGHLRQSGPIAVRALLEAISADLWTRAAVLPTLWWMVGHGRLETDLDVQLTMQSIVCLPHGQDV
jgi:hypothetical protein